MTEDLALARMAPIGGWFFQDEARLLYRTAVDAMEHFPGAAIVEVGSFQGRSTIVLGTAAQACGRTSKVYAVDPHEGTLTRFRVSPTWEAFNANLKRAGVNDVVTPIRQKSSDVSWAARGWIALLHVDGLHDAENVRIDCQQFLPYVPPGGRIAFHDYSNPDHPDVRAFVDGLVRAGILAVRSLPETPGRESSLIVTKKRASLSVIVPTCGRATLRRTLESIVAAGASEIDEVLVAADGPQPVASGIVEGFRACPFAISYYETEPTGAVGAHQRNVAMAHATKSHLVFIDDDDVYVPGAFEWIREAAEEHSGRIILFKEEERRPEVKWGVVWKTKEVRYGNVGTQMIVLPNVQNLFGRWPNHRGSDYEFLRSTLDLWPGGEAGIIWVDRVIARLY